MSVVAPSSIQWRQRGTSCSPPELFCTGHDSEIKGSDENDSERQSSDSLDNSDGDTQSDCSDCFEVMFQTQRSINVTVQKQRIHVNISRRGRGMG